MVNYKKGIMLFSIVLFVFILVINIFQPYTADEYNYSIISGTIDEKVSNLIDIVKSQWNLFFTWTGRNLVHFNLQLLLLMGKGVFNFLNAVMFVSLIFLITLFTKITRFNKKEDFLSLVFVLFLVWFGLPAFGETIIWEAGAVNYLWVAVVSLVFLLPYRYLLDGKHLLKDDKKSLAIMVILGLLAGWSQENQAIVNVFVVGSFSLYFWLKVKIRTLPKWYYGGLFSVVLGSGILLLAPGNFNRSSTVDNEFTQSEKFQNFKNGLDLLFYEQRYLFLFLVVVVVALLLMILLRNNIIKSKKTEVYLSVVFILGGSLSVIAMFFSPAFPPRSSFAAGIAFIVSISFIMNSTFLDSLNKRLYNLPLIVLVVLLFNSMIFNFQQYKQLNEEHQNRIEIIKENVKKGNLNVKVPFYQDIKFNIHMFGWDITEDKDHYYNNIMTKYFGLNTIKGVKGDHIETSTSLQIKFDNNLETNTYSAYYDIGKGFNNRHMFGEYIKDSEQVKEIVFPIPEDTVQNLRIQFGKGEYLIQSIAIKKDNKIYKLDPTQIISDFVPSDGIDEYIIVGDFIKLKVNSDDSFLEIEGFNDKLPEF
ncbi:DUF3329 domain-containing protein [Paenibacillus glacialis]|uniref:Glycosyltransferase RgtA/B/C/D-like domain-containing protein n=1 Tax=Paenibacillus glacialis TaxID=494026 RepID=A0A162K4R1_9BACL|nr:DUF6056 family protein [Paenibacillus glacialis]OAB42996.1 hypothetical protein PGLA_11125 [Paenibacillus glacialis]